ncbi:HIRAN domain-containing protein [Paenibacillus soyae]|uniref:HIRAN domain-containing protein n=1 Tax=Paenibacillus soyae TaxID=2969249 RepID=A0A9X2MNM0_9BACL|nr:HIRAN domain-containing protein [Paenibacillus soyae]MCR2803996.1 HIRAN domain-containing protein [Paenibacillus soyae]
MEQPVYVAIVGTSFYFGTGFLKPGQPVQLIKDPDNRHDQEAIKAVMPPVGKIGYVANSSNTVPKGCRSAGRIYDTFDDHAIGVVRFVMKDTAIAEIVPHYESIFVFHSTEAITFTDR